MTYLTFDLLGKSASGKTSIWVVSSNVNGCQLGTIKWNSPWRRYCFFADQFTIFDAACLSEILEFIKRRMDDWRDDTTARQSSIALDG